MDSSVPTCFISRDLVQLLRVKIIEQAVVTGMRHPQYWFGLAVSIYLLDMTLLKDTQQDGRRWHMFHDSRLYISLLSLLITLCFHHCTGHWKFMASFMFHFSFEGVWGLNNLGPYSLGPNAIENQLQESFLWCITTYVSSGYTEDLNCKGLRF